MVSRALDLQREPGLIVQARNLTAGVVLACFGVVGVALRRVLDDSVCSVGLVLQHTVGVSHALVSPNRVQGWCDYDDGLHLMLAGTKSKDWGSRATHHPDKNTNCDSNHEAGDCSLLVPPCTLAASVTVKSLLTRIHANAMPREGPRHVSGAPETTALERILDPLYSMSILLVEQALPFLPQGTAKATDRRDVGSAEGCDDCNVDQQEKDGEGRRKQDGREVACVTVSELWVLG